MLRESREGFGFRVSRFIRFGRDVMTPDVSTASDRADIDASGGGSLRFNDAVEREFGGVTAFYSEGSALVQQIEVGDRLLSEPAEDRQRAVPFIERIRIATVCFAQSLHRPHASAPGLPGVLTES